MVAAPLAATPASKNYRVAETKGWHQPVRRFVVRRRAALLAGVAILDLNRLRLAMIHPDRIDYAASVAKVGILLAYFQLHPEALHRARRWPKRAS